MKCRLWRWKRPVGLTSQCRIILCSIFCCAFPGLITQSSSDGIWQEYSSFLTGILSQVPLVSLFSHLHSIMLLSRISSLYPCWWLLEVFFPRSKSVACSCLQSSSLSQDGCSAIHVFPWGWGFSLGLVMCLDLRVIIPGPLMIFLYP